VIRVWGLAWVVGLLFGWTARLPLAAAPSSPAATIPTEAFSRRPAEIAKLSPQAHLNQLRFAVRFRDQVSRLPILGIFAMPGEEIHFTVLPERDGGRYRCVAGAGNLKPQSPEGWRWAAPDQPGLYPLQVSEEDIGDTIAFNIFVMVPFDPESTALNRFQLGRFREEPYRNNPFYNRPPGFVEVTPANMDAPVAPHFRLRQFLCKQEGGFPKYLVLHETLLLKLEEILHQLGERGIQADTLHVMSGFRTPFYNAAIGNQTSYSCHLYGGAADIFVDRDGDGAMDDLDGDGESNLSDAKLLAGVVLELEQRDSLCCPGGLGIYGPKPHRGPFVHVDVRGWPARWNG